MRKQRPRRDRIRLKNALGIVVLVLAAITVGGLAWVWIGMPSPSRNANNCTSDGPQSITVIAVDATDVLDEVQRLALRNELSKVVGNIRPDDGVQVWRVAPSDTAVPDAAGPLLCNPGKTVSPWFGNPATVAKDYVQKFQQPLSDQIDGFIRGVSAPQSPIMESVQAIALRTFDRPEYESAKAKVLVVASDMIQNTATYSQVRGVEPFVSFESTMAARKLAPHLTGVRVKLLYIQRPLAPNFKQHIEFWQQYFFAAGAKLEEVVPVAGVSERTTKKN